MKFVIQRGLLKIVFNPTFKKLFSLIAFYTKAVKFQLYVLKKNYL